MSASSGSPLPSPFSAHEYQIVCLPPDEPDEVNIRGSGAQPLRVGDLYTIAPGGCFCDLVVKEISLAAGGRWNARCQVSCLRWL